MSCSDKVKILLRWCAANSIFIDDRIQVRLQDAVECADLGVFSTESYIPPHTTLVKIPKEAILSVRTCSLANHIPVVSYGIGAQLSLSLALYVEILKHNQSRWYCYLQSLPNDLVDLPLFWLRMAEKTDFSDGYDCAEALLWLTGTEAAKILDSKMENGSNILVEITNFFNDVAEPLLRTQSGVWMKSSLRRPTIEGFYRAFSLVSSRAFLVDTYHGLSMVPIADAFNHTVENHVHLESDYLVCPECGSLRECAHDWDDLLLPLDHHDHGHDTFYEIVSNSGIAPNSEVFNTYGETLSNSQLLNQYGFVLDVNENDRLLWSAQEILDMCVQDEGAEKSVETAILKAGGVLLDSLSNLSHFFDQSQLVCRESDGGHSLYLDDEGKISAGLWALVTAFSLMSSLQSTDIDIDYAKQLTEIVDAQLRMESLSGVDDWARVNSPARDIVLQTARAVVKLCDRRKKKSGKPSSFECNLSDLLGQVPQCHRRTRLAISVLLTERSILDACQAGWGEHYSSTMNINSIFEDSTRQESKSTNEVIA